MNLVESIEFWQQEIKLVTVICIVPFSMLYIRFVDLHIGIFIICLNLLYFIKKEE